MLLKLLMVLTILPAFSVSKRKALFNQQRAFFGLRISGTAALAGNNPYSYLVLKMGKNIWNTFEICRRNTCMESHIATNADTAGIVDKLSPQSPVNHWRHMGDIAWTKLICTAPEPFDTQVSGLIATAVEILAWRSRLLSARSNEETLWIPLILDWKLIFGDGSDSSFSFSSSSSKCSGCLVP